MTMVEVQKGTYKFLNVKIPKRIYLHLIKVKVNLEFGDWVSTLYLLSKIAEKVMMTNPKIIEEAKLEIIKEEQEEKAKEVSEDPSVGGVVGEGSESSDVEHV